MKLIKKLVTGAATLAAGAAIVLGGTAPASAAPASVAAPTIDVVHNPFSCLFDIWGKGEFFVFTSRAYGATGNSYLCIENAGAMWNMDVANTVQWHSGNNAGLFTYTPSGGNKMIKTFEKWQSDTAEYGWVDMINIY